MPVCDDRSMTIWSRLLMVLAFFAAVFAAPVQAQVGPGPHIRHSIVAESAAPAPGSSVDVALVMVPDAGWHGYWKNGGDAGFGMQIEWTLPPGVSIGELNYPVPETLVIAGLMNHVYEHPYALIAPLRIAGNVASGTRLPIRGEATWLACTDQVCVPETGTFTLDLTVGDGRIDAATRARFDGWRMALPQPLGSPVTYQRDGDSLRLGIPYPAGLAVRAPHLFVATQRADQPGAVQGFSRSGDLLIVETKAGSDLGNLRSFDALIATGDGRGFSFTAEPGNVPPAGAPVGPDVQEAMAQFDWALFLTALAGAVIGGLILNIMPCVFPILSLKALALARAGGEAREARIEGFAYTAGTIFTCLALGAVLLLLRAGGEAVGWAFQLQSPPSVLLLIVLTAAITANLAGLFEIGSLSFNFGRASTAGGAPASPAKQAFGTGALAAFIATPCSGPFLGAALGATLALPVWAALPIFGGLGLGLALPFLLLALIPRLRTRLPKPGPWMERMRRWLAIPMMLTVAALIWLLGRQVGLNGWLVGAAMALVTFGLAWLAGRQQGGGRHAGPVFIAMAAAIVPAALLLPQPVSRDGAALAQASLLEAEPWSAARVAALRAQGRPLFVYFTADWCVSCKVNEASSIEREETAAAFRAAGVKTLVGDWTNADPEITRELATHQRNSVPLYLWYPAGGGEPQILPQVLTPGLLTGLAAQP